MYVVDHAGTGQYRTIQEAINAVPDNNNGWDTATSGALIGGDKSAFYRCGAESLQDTLCDYHGRLHCFIEGGVDFIFGYAQSLYDNCHINVIKGDWSGPGWVTAQGRQKGYRWDGFVFKYCTITGNAGAVTYLGRA
ncbi:putative pectinesterase 8 [Acorus calamus]|uniref:pectinesterase n=1 Tax=Acorus calamus TaxID=4465 RepID=A0AAV9EZT4_ACOCL|nr:putative pectinesterase 8 [Acorus calamus]